MYRWAGIDKNGRECNICRLVWDQLFNIFFFVGEMPKSILMWIPIHGVTSKAVSVIYHLTIVINFDSHTYTHTPNEWVRCRALGTALIPIHWYCYWWVYEHPSKMVVAALQQQHAYKWSDCFRTFTETDCKFTVCVLLLSAIQ